MKRIAKYLGIAVLALALVLTLAGWALNRWLKSPEFHAAFDQELSRAMRLPVKTGGIDFSAWRGLSVQSLTIAGAEGSAFEFSGISASHRLLPLLRGKLTLAEVRIEKPRLRLVQDDAGAWRLPGSKPPAKPASAAAPVAPPAAPAPASPPPSAPAITQASPPAPAPARKRSSPIIIERVVMTGGSVELIGKNQAPFATLTDINATLNDATGENLSGSLAIRRVTLHGWFTLDNFTAVVGRDGRAVQLRQIAAASGSGTVTGDAAWTEGAAATANLKLDNISVALTAQAAGAANPRIGGMLSGTAQFAGIGADRNAMTGSGQLTLTGASTREIEMLRQIGEVLQIATIASFEISAVTANFRVEQSRVFLSPADVAARPVGLTLNGPVAFDGTLDLTGILHAPADFVARNAVIAPQFSPPDAENRRGVQFNITGSLSKPRQNLAERLTGTSNRREQNVIAAGAAATAILESTPLGKHNQKLLKMLPQLLPVKKKAPEPAPAPAPAPAATTPAPQ